MADCTSKWLDLTLFLKCTIQVKGVHFTYSTVLPRITPYSLEYYAEFVNVLGMLPPTVEPVLRDQSHYRNIVVS